MQKVLVCDDDKNVRFQMTFALTGLGWEVVTIDDCSNLIEKVIEHQPAVLIMDNLIPDAGAIQAIQTLKANAISKDIPVILTSSDRGISSLAEEAGADFYLQIPADIQKLKSVMKDSYKRFLLNHPGENSAENSEIA